MELNYNEINWFGRTLDYKNIRYFDYSASGFEFYFYGKKAECTILSDSAKFNKNEKCVLGVFITKDDGIETLNKIILEENENHLTLFTSEKNEKVHIKVMRFSEAIYGYSGFANAQIDGELLPFENTSSNLKLEFIGDSITCGYGIEGVWGKDVFSTKQERPDLAYAFLTAKKLNAQVHLVSRSGIGLISCYTDPLTVNLPNLAEPLISQIWPYTDRFLSVRLGIEPEVWDEKRYSPDIVILHIGTNDASWVRKIEERRLSFINLYKQMLEAIHRRSPNAKILGCLGAMGQDLCSSEKEAFEQFKKDFPTVQTKFVQLPLQLQDEDGVGTDWHPSAKTHQKIAEILSQEIQNW